MMRWPLAPGSCARCQYAAGALSGWPRSRTSGVPGRLRRTHTAHRGKAGSALRSATSSIVMSCTCSGARVGRFAGWLSNAPAEPRRRQAVDRARNCRMLERTKPGRAAARTKQFLAESKAIGLATEEKPWRTNCTDCDLASARSGHSRAPCDDANFVFLLGPLDSTRLV